MTFREGGANMSQDAAPISEGAPSRKGSVVLIAIFVFVLTFGVGMLIYPRPATKNASSALASESTSTAAESAGETTRVPSAGLTLIRPHGWSTISADQNVRNI